MSLKQVIADTEAWIESLRWNEQGLLPAIVQDAETQAVLMMAYMNRESLRLSVEQGETVFWSRSRKELWHKGATSGNTQRIVDMAADCDRDTLLFQVKPNGPACHRDTYTCFDERDSGSYHETHNVLDRLAQTIAERERERPEGSYTTYLFNQGIDKILKKIGEEAAEIIIAAKNGDESEIAAETGDLLFHLLVLLQARGLSLNQVLLELDQRHNKPRRDTYSDSGKVKE